MQQQHQHYIICSLSATISDECIKMIHHCRQPHMWPRNTQPNLETPTPSVKNKGLAATIQPFQCSTALLYSYIGYGRQQKLSQVWEQSTKYIYVYMYLNLIFMHGLLEDIATCFFWFISQELLINHKQSTFMIPCK